MIKVTVTMMEELIDSFRAPYCVEHEFRIEGVSLTTVLNKAQEDHPGWLLGGYITETKGYRG